MVSDHSISMVAALSPQGLFLTSHSQTIATRQPLSRSSTRLQRSLPRLAASFAARKSVLLDGVVARRRPMYLCQ